MLREFSSWWPYDVNTPKHSVRVFEPLSLLRTEDWSRYNKYRLCIHYFHSEIYSQYFLYPDWMLEKYEKCI